MKYCLSARQSKEYLEKADEILVEWRDNDAILDILEINPKASIVLRIPLDVNLTSEEWDRVAQYYIMTQKRFKVMLSTINVSECRKRNIPFFLNHPVYTGWEANALIFMGVSSIYIAGQLAHQLDFVKTLPVEIRILVNSATAPFGYKPLMGGWIRPEDIEKVSDAIDVCEFTYRDRRDEQALYRVYAEKHEWAGELYMIIKDIEDKTIMNRMIPPEFQERRNNCGMRCQSGGHCHLCETITYLANPDILRPVKEQLDKNV